MKMIGLKKNQIKGTQKKKNEIIRKIMMHITQSRVTIIHSTGTTYTYTYHQRAHHTYETGAAKKKENIK